MTIKDRGTKKWTSFFMAEQVEMVQQMFKEDEYKQKPELDEQELKEINHNIHYAIHEGLPVEITYFANHDYLKVKGTLLSVDLHTRKVRLNDEERTTINLDDVLHITID